MATPVTIYGPPLSTAVSRVLATLIEKDVPFHLVPIDLSKGEQKKPEYLKIQVLISISVLVIAIFIPPFTYSPPPLTLNSPLAKYQLLKTRASPSLVNYTKF
jgi:hypothetical protein